MLLKNPLLLNQWVSFNIPETNMLWFNDFHEQMKTMMSIKCKHARVISTHVSKSIELPVVHITFNNGNSIIVRHNFIDYVISASLYKPLPKEYEYVFEDNGKIRIPQYLCEGFDKSIIYDSFNTNQSRFTVKCSCREDFIKFVNIINTYTKK